MAVLLFFFTIFLCVVTINEACWCTQAHPQSRFCSADLVSTGDILLLATHITFSNHFKPVIYIHNYFHAHFHLLTFKRYTSAPNSSIKS